MYIHYIKIAPEKNSIFAHRSSQIDCICMKQDQRKQKASASSTFY